MNPLSWSDSIAMEKSEKKRKQKKQTILDKYPHKGSVDVHCQGPAVQS